MKFFSPVHPNTGDCTGQVICQQCLDLDYLFGVKREAIQELALPDPAKACSICGEAPGATTQPHAAIDCPPTGAQLKRQGQKRVMDNEREAWKASAMDQIERLCRNCTTLTADDVRKVIYERGIGEPHHPNVYGGLMKLAAARGWIAKTGHYEKSEVASRHAGMIMVWRSLLT